MEPDSGAPQPPREKPAPVDDESLRGTRFEFGGRRPYSYAPPRPAYRSSGRPLPGVGTVALGKVSRTTQYGAFVDFLGFRGLVHISQLVPGMRVERVEDVVNVGDEVRVRVIAVDPERRHINLALDPLAVDRPSVSVSGSSPMEEAPAKSATGEGARSGPVDAPAEPSTQEHPSTGTAHSEVIASDDEEPGETPSQASRAWSAPQPAEQQTMSVAQPEPVAPSPTPPAVPGTAAARPDRSARGVMPAAAVPPRNTARPASATPGTRPAGSASALARPGSMAGNRPAAPGQKKPVKPIPPEVARHGARAVRRELEEPTHPMARLLSGGRGLAVPPVPKERSRAGQEIEEQAPAPVAPVPPRPIHVAEPEPEPQTEQPATLEALAARFGQRREKPGKPGPASPKAGSDRSRLEREKQAAILEKMRRGR